MSAAVRWMKILHVGSLAWRKKSHWSSKLRGAKWPPLPTGATAPSSWCRFPSVGEASRKTETQELKILPSPSSDLHHGGQT
ncbi:hypothetical protein QYE76_047529 [Lolium multiflorum]|uniref:Uncharacterized protein n=1 Tax=Lolium multiflorum TaxID=4521 RepID=A0AAD8TS41_LOLMU|nr:hypothetical protein QYE76_047529 [Lolium multiflorum]